MMKNYESFQSERNIIIINRKTIKVKRIKKHTQLRTALRSRKKLNEKIHLYLNCDQIN